MQDQPVRKPWRQSLRLSLRVLMIFVLLVGGGLGWIVHTARVQRDAVAAIKSAGGSARYDWEWNNRNPIPAGRPWAPRWLVDLLGVDYFGHVAAVYLDRGIRWGFFHDRRDLNPTLAHVGQLRQLEWLHLHASSMTDESLVHLKGLTNLRTLVLSSTDVGDAGLLHLKDLTNLRALILDATRVGDAGLAHVRRLRQLDTLTLKKTAITDGGMVHLRELTRLQWLQLDETQISDTGLKNLKDLTNLQTLSLRKTQVNGTGLADLEGLPNLRYLSLMDNMVTEVGVEHLKKLSTLNMLTLGGAKVSKAGVTELRQGPKDASCPLIQRPPDTLNRGSAGLNRSSVMPSVTSTSVATELRRGDTTKKCPFTIVIVSNPALESPWRSGAFVIDPITLDQVGFNACANYINDSLFGGLLGQAEQLMNDPAIAPNVRVVSLFITGLAAADPNALVAEDSSVKSA